jgi:ribosomal-protein-alanine N-acetyltransferase
MGEIPVFETERLILRGVALADAAATQKHFNDHEVIRELAATVPWPYPSDGARQFIENIVLPVQAKDRWVWGIFLQTKPSELIGIIDLWRKEKPDNRGFWLARKHWGNGIMTEAVAPVTAYAFDVLGFERLILSNAIGNLRSRRIKEKAGARRLRAEPAKFGNPDYTEREIWELTKADWLKMRMTETRGRTQIPSVPLWAVIPPRRSLRVSRAPCPSPLVSPSRLPFLPSPPRAVPLPPWPGPLSAGWTASPFPL